MSVYSDDDKNKHFTGAETLYSYEGWIWDDTQLPQYLGGYNGDPVATGDFPVDDRGAEVPVHPMALQVACDVSERSSKAGFNGIRYRIMDAGFLHGPLGVKRMWRDTAGVNHSAYRVLPGLNLRWGLQLYRWSTEEQSRGFEFASSGVDDPIKQWRERCLRSTSAIIMTDSLTDSPLCAVLLYDLRYRFVLDGKHIPWDVQHEDFGTNFVRERFSHGHRWGILVQLIDLRSLGVRGAKAKGTWRGLSDTDFSSSQGDNLFPVTHSGQSTSYKYTRVLSDRADHHHVEQVQNYKESTRIKLQAHSEGAGTTGGSDFYHLTRANGMRAFYVPDVHIPQRDLQVGLDEPFIPDRKLPVNIRTQVHKLVKGLSPPAKPTFDTDSQNYVASTLHTVKVEMCSRVGRATRRVGREFDRSFRKNPPVAEVVRLFKPGGRSWEKWSPNETLGDLVSLLAKGSSAHDYIEVVPEELLSVLAGEQRRYQEEWYRLTNHMKYVIREDLTSGSVWHSEIGDDCMKELFLDKGLSALTSSADKFPCRLYHSWDAWEKCFNDDPLGGQVATLKSFLLSADNQPEAEWVSEESSDPIRYMQSWSTAVSGWRKIPNSTPYVKGLGWAYRSEPLALEASFGRKRGNNIFIIEG